MLNLIEPSISLSVGPNIYGMYQFKNPRFKRLLQLDMLLLHHVSVSYRPDLGNMVEILLYLL